MPILICYDGSHRAARAISLARGRWLSTKRSCYTCGIHRSRFSPTRSVIRAHPDPRWRSWSNSRSTVRRRSHGKVTSWPALRG